MENIIYNELLIRGYNVDVGMVEKGLERESDDVIVGEKAEGLKRVIW